jgi:DNA-binding HxlR family transcriptional regulator
MKCKPADVFNADCPSRDVLELVGSKWSMLAICTLKNGPVRTGELRRAISGISQKMLTQTLRELERNGIIDRIDHKEVPPRVEYKLTKVGHSVGRLMKQMEHWITNHYDYIMSSQRRYDSQDHTPEHMLSA